MNPKLTYGTLFFLLFCVFVEHEDWALFIVDCFASVDLLAFLSNPLFICDMVRVEGVAEDTFVRYWWGVFTIDDLADSSASWLKLLYCRISLNGSSSYFGFLPLLKSLFTDLCWASLDCFLPSIFLTHAAVYSLWFNFSIGDLSLLDIFLNWFGAAAGFWTFDKSGLFRIRVGFIDVSFFLMNRVLDPVSELDFLVIFKFSINFLSYFWGILLLVRFFSSLSTSLALGDIGLLKKLSSFWHDFMRAFIFLGVLLSGLGFNSFLDCIVMVDFYEYMRR